MDDDADRFVGQAFELLFDRAREAGDRSSRERSPGISDDQAFEDGRALAFYQAIRKLWLLARGLGLHEQGLGAPGWHPDEVDIPA